MILKSTPPDEQLVHGADEGKLKLSDTRVLEPKNGWGATTPGLAQPHLIKYDKNDVAKHLGVAGLSDDEIEELEGELHAEALMDYV